MREIVLDTETTGFSYKKGDRIIEIGCVELINGTRTGNSFQTYLNPEGRKVHPKAMEVHGITDEFLEDKPLFSEKVDEFLAFIGDADIVSHSQHNFDFKFLNMELERLGLEPLSFERSINSLDIAKEKFPGKGIARNIDSLCARFNVKAKREVHGALLDAEILADIYPHLKSAPTPT